MAYPVRPYLTSKLLPSCLSTRRAKINFMEGTGRMDHFHDIAYGRMVDLSWWSGCVPPRAAHCRIISTCSPGSANVTDVHEAVMNIGCVDLLAVFES